MFLNNSSNDPSSSVLKSKSTTFAFWNFPLYNSTLFSSTKSKLFTVKNLSSIVELLRYMNFIGSFEKRLCNSKATSSKSERLRYGFSTTMIQSFLSFSPQSLI